ncbi:phage holin family protein [Serratia liquefaciens]|uniref:phage holin family protein n=1 Tax=Serratia liquefaciens TaxID=614 RepID=UPI003524CDAF
MRMPHNDNAFLGWLANLYSSNANLINGMVITSALAFGRVLFYGGKIRTALVDALLTGLIAVTTVPVLSPLLVRSIEMLPGMGDVLSKTETMKIELFVFSVLGVIGARVIREAAISILQRISGLNRKGVSDADK